jgi:hypothetical protein
MHSEPNMGAGLGHRIITKMGGLLENKFNKDTQMKEISRCVTKKKQMRNLRHVDGYLLPVWPILREASDRSQNFNETAANGHLKSQN